MIRGFGGISGEVRVEEESLERYQEIGGAEGSRSGWAGRWWRSNRREKGSEMVWRRLTAGAIEAPLMKWLAPHSAAPAPTQRARLRAGTLPNRSLMWPSTSVEIRERWQGYRR